MITTIGLPGYHRFKCGLMTWCKASSRSSYSAQTKPNRNRQKTSRMIMVDDDEKIWCILMKAQGMGALVMACGRLPILEVFSLCLMLDKRIGL